MITSRLNNRLDRLERAAGPARPSPQHHLMVPATDMAEAILCLYDLMNEAAWEELLESQGWPPGEICPHVPPVIHLADSTISEPVADNHQPQPCCGKIRLTLVETDGHLIGLRNQTPAGDNQG